MIGFSKFILTFALLFNPKNFINIMEELLQKFAEEAANFQADGTAQMLKGNKAAGLRARKSALALISVLKEFRKVSTEASKA